MSKTSYDWPRLYLLGLYRDAVEQGHIIVEGLTVDRAQSLKMAFYRLRRRSDESNKSIILPEYHLVTVGEWRSTGYGPQGEHGMDGDLIGHMPILYNSIPDASLPLVRSATTGQLLPTINERSHQPPIQPTVLPPSDHFELPESLNQALGMDAEIGSEDIGDYIAKLRAKAASGD